LLNESFVRNKRINKGYERSSFAKGDFIIWSPVRAESFARTKIREIVVKYFANFNFRTNFAKRNFANDILTYNFFYTSIRIV